MTMVVNTRRAEVLVCATCGASSVPVGAPPAGLLLARNAVGALGGATDVRVTTVRCLANCGRGPSAAIRCEGAWTYIFGQLDQAEDGAALVAGARLLAAAADGLLPWRGRPDALKRIVIARLPPADRPGDPVEPA